MRRSVVVALAAGLAVIGLVTAAVLAHSPLTIAATNSVSRQNYIELEEKGKLSTCQPAGTIPRGTSAIQIGIEGLHFSPGVTVKILTGSRVLAEGQRIAGGPSIPTVTVPVKPLARAISQARICTTVGPAVEPIRFYGAPKHSSAAQANPLQEAELHMAYLRPGSKSWWSFAPSVVKHLGLGHAPSGKWVAFLVLILMLTAIAIASRLILEELR
jgi:hypothetical protein